MDEGAPQPAEDRAESSSVILLRHPSGSQVYIVATAHISEQSQQDVRDTIEQVGPAAVVVELDEERMQRLRKAAASSDRFGLEHFKGVGTLPILRMALTGELLPYAMGLVYVATGALMGTRPGGEFVAAAEAAEASGVPLILADRPQGVTMRRLQWYTRQLRPDPSTGRQDPAAPLHRRLEGDLPGRDPGSFPDFMRREGDPGAGHVRAQARAEAEAAVRNAPDSTWGLGGTEEDDNSESAMKARLLSMMREGGCPQPNAVLAAAQRLLRAGMDPKGSIESEDVLAVRSCGRTLVENFRRRAIGGDDSWMQRVEVESVAGAGGSVGAKRSALAMRKVIVDERDLILARRLWEAGEEVAPQPVVGVVGAGHVRGIQKYWDQAGSPATAQRVEEFLSLPPGEGPPSALAMAVTGGIFGFIAWRRPRAAAFFLGTVTLATAPYLGFSLFSMRRFTSFASKLVATCDRIEDSSGGGMAADGWPRGDSEWQ